MNDNMDKAVGMLRELLADPEASKKLSGLIDAIAPKVKPEEISRQMAAPEPVHTQQPDNMAMLNRMRTVYDKVSANAEDPRLNLLMALKPYLNQKRMKNLDNAMKILSFSRLSNIMNEMES